MNEVKLHKPDEGDLAEFTANALGVSIERARKIVAINFPNSVEIAEVQAGEQTQEGEINGKDF